MIHVLPGMGADHRMYADKAWQKLPTARFLDWPDHRDESTISAIASRVITDAKVSAGDIVIGSSLGGIVGCEIANQIPLAQLVLIGSAKNKAEISSLLALFHPLAQLAPLDFIRLSAGKIPVELTQMFSASQASFIRAMCSAIFSWSGLHEARLKPLRIHGKNDRVIPLPHDIDHPIEGGHLIAMTRAAECVSLIEPHLTKAA